jgi:hypothetical protein
VFTGGSSRAGEAASICSTVWPSRILAGEASVDSGSRGHRFKPHKKSSNRVVAKSNEKLQLSETTGFLGKILPIVKQPNL